LLCVVPYNAPSFVAATSNGFSVCAHPLKQSEKFFGDIDDEHGVGMSVAITFESDSGDLDKVEFKEVVELSHKDEPPFKEAFRPVIIRNYLPIIPPPGQVAGDEHKEPRPSAGPKGIAEYDQLHIFKCLRCGAVDQAIPNSGFSIRNEVFPAGKQWKHKVTKKGDIISLSLPDSKIRVTTRAGSGEARSPDHDLPGKFPWPRAVLMLKAGATARVEGNYFFRVARYAGSRISRKALGDSRIL
jgi:hypothetical protein